MSLGCTLVRILNGLCLQLTNHCGLRCASSEDPCVWPCMTLRPTNPTYSCIVGAHLVLLLRGGEKDVNIGEVRNVFDVGCRATPSVLCMGTRAEIT